jgi:signal peptidase I
MQEFNDQEHISEEKNLPTSTEKSATGHIWEIFKFFLLALIIVAPIRFFIAQPFIVQGKSMSPTFETGQYLIIDEITYKFEEPKRGDVIVLRYPKDTTKFFIKRVIGLPGETLTITDGMISITSKDGETIVLDEPYITFPKTDRADNMTITLKDNPESDTNDEYFVMGDNRAASLDSRVWGTLPERLIVGRALVRLFPFSLIGLFPGQHIQIEEAL